MTSDNFPPSGYDWIYQTTILGEPASKANSRQLVTNRHTKRPMFIKSKKAQGYVKAFEAQIRHLDEPIDFDVVVAIKIHYASRRPDLDESVILDCLQGPVYANDRQVKVKHIYWALDKENPRAEIFVAPL